MDSLEVDSQEGVESQDEVVSRVVVVEVVTGLARRVMPDGAPVSDTVQR